MKALLGLRGCLIGLTPPVRIPTPSHARKICVVRTHYTSSIHVHTRPMHACKMFTYESLIPCIGAYTQPTPATLFSTKIAPSLLPAHVLPVKKTFADFLRGIENG